MSTTSQVGFRTEIEFELPKGYVDETGALHRQGTMRLATAADEILPLRDPRVQQNEAYLVAQRRGRDYPEEHQEREGHDEIEPGTP